MARFDKSPDNLYSQTTSTVTKDEDLGHCSDQQSQRWWDSRCNRRRLIPWTTNLSSWLRLSSGLLYQSCQLGSSRWVKGHLSERPAEHLPGAFPQTSKNQINRPPQAATAKKTISTSLPSLSFPFFKTSNVHKQLHSDVKNKQKKNSWVLFLTAASTEGFATYPFPWALQPKTIAAAGSMHICHARRIGGPDGCDTVAGASTNVCGCPCRYLYHGETQTHKYLQKESETLFLFGVKVVNNADRWD